MVQFTPTSVTHNAFFCEFNKLAEMNRWIWIRLLSFMIEVSFSVKFEILISVKY